MFFFIYQYHIICAIFSRLNFRLSQKSYSFLAFLTQVSFNPQKFQPTGNPLWCIDMFQTVSDNKKSRCPKLVYVYYIHHTPPLWCSRNPRPLNFERDQEFMNILSIFKSIIRPMEEYRAKREKMCKKYICY